MPRQKPADMSDEMWAAVCIIMEDHQISSYKEMTESHQAMIQRMDELETKWSEKAVEGDPAGGDGASQADSGAAGQGGNGAAGAVGSDAVGEGSGVTPPPVVEKTVEGGDDEKTGSGRGGRLRWYEREGYAKS